MCEHRNRFMSQIEAHNYNKKNNDSVSFCKCAHAHYYDLSRVFSVVKSAQVVLLIKLIVLTQMFNSKSQTNKLKTIKTSNTAAIHTGSRVSTFPADAQKTIIDFQPVSFQ